MNAESFEKRGFSHVMDQNNLTPDSLVEAAIRLYHDRGSLYEAMRADSSNSGGVDNVLEQIYKHAKVE